MTIELDIDVAPLKAAADVLTGADELVGRIAEGFVEDVAAEAERNVRRRAGRHRVTGAMESHIRSAELGDGITARARVIVDDRIAAIIVRGSAAHVISPTRGKVLTLTGRGAVSFARRVKHPGTVADPFVELAFDDTISAAESEADSAGERLAGGLADELTRRA